LNVGFGPVAAVVKEGGNRTVAAIAECQSNKMESSH
jgi:hypothetical protein